jgi:uncharacterized protein YlaI
MKFGMLSRMYAKRRRKKDEHFLSKKCIRHRPERSMLMDCDNCGHRIGCTTSSALYHVRGKPGNECEFSTTCWECSCRYPKIKEAER